MPHPNAPTIDELLSDSLIQAVMRADKVDADQLKGLLEGVAAKRPAHRPRVALTSMSTLPGLGPEKRAPALLDWARGCETGACA